MTTPFDDLRRVEDLERRLAAREKLLRNQAGRPARQEGKRWQFLVQTIADAQDTPAYPASGDTFKVRFLDIAWEATVGLSSYTPAPRAASWQAIAKNVPGDYLPEGTVALATFHPPPPGTSDKGKWILNESTSGIVRFRLTADLSNGGNAAALLLKFDGAAYVAGAACVVFDWYSLTAGAPGLSRGMWQGKSGMEGFALKREFPLVAGRQEYDLVWMETYAWSLESTTAAALGGSGSGGAAATTSAAIEQGVSPGNPPLHDDQDFFPRSLANAKAKGVRSEYEGANPYYKAINAQQMALYGDALLYEPLTATDATVDLEPANFRWWTFSPFNQEPDPLPTTAENLFGLSGSAGDRVFIVWDEAIDKWIIVQVLGKGVSRTIRFRLLQPLQVGGSADAVVIVFDGANYVSTGEAIVVYDWYSITPQAPGTSRGMWSGDTGMEGVAGQREAIAGDPDTPEFDIIWMETYAWDAEVRLLGNLHGSGAGAGTGEVLAAFHQGDIPSGGEGDSINVHDDLSMFPAALKNAKCIVQRDEYSDFEYYRAVQCQQLAFHATARIQAKLCGGLSAELQVGSFVPRMFSPFNLPPDPAPETAQNPFKHRGMPGALVWLVWGEADPNDPESEAGWIIIDIERQPVPLVTNVRFEGGCFYQDRYTVAAEICDPYVTNTIVCGTACP